MRKRWRFFLSVVTFRLCCFAFPLFSTRANHSLHLLNPEIAQCMSILLRFTGLIKWLLAEMTGHLSLDTLRETRLPRIKDTLLEPIFIQLQGYPLRWLTTLNFSIFSLTKLDFTYYSLLCFVICSPKLCQSEAISLNVFPPARAICRDRFWSVKMDTSLELTMTDGCFLRSSLESAKFSRVLWNHLPNGHLRILCTVGLPMYNTWCVRSNFSLKSLQSLCAGEIGASCPFFPVYSIVQLWFSLEKCISYENVMCLAFWNIFVIFYSFVD